MYTGAPRSGWVWSHPTRGTAGTCSTPANGSSPTAPRSTSCRPGSGSGTTPTSDLPASRRVRGVRRSAPGIICRVPTIGAGRTGSPDTDADVMADTARARKLADRIREIVAETLERRVKDPRLGFVTITDARVTGDLQHATLFYTVLGDAEEQAATRVALESAKGVLRSEVGRRIGVRLTPTLEFIADAVPENAAHIDELLQAAAARDADVAALAASAQYAGDADPYRHEEDEDEDVEVVDRR